ncbi:MAG: phosphatase PAP2 family protein [Acidobacteria bacterium]|nr:phosphatase PAP2 family protein [Acidobacteriota bacterium]
MTLQIGSLLCLATIPFGIGNSLHHTIAKYPSPERWRAHRFNAIGAIGFTTLAFIGAGSEWGSSVPMTLVRLIAPIIYYWYAYALAGPTLHIFHPPEFSYDRPLIRAEQRFFGNPSLWLARGRSKALHEFMQFFYWTYFFYIPALGFGLYLQGDLARFEAMAMATSLGYAICYSIYPWYPLWGPRWALVDEGLLPDDEKILPGYFFANFMNRIIWSDTAHKGGAMPSAHSSTCVIFMIWCARVWGTEGIVVGGFIGTFMYISTVYGRYHYIIDVLVGTVIGFLAVYLADLIVLA